MAFPRLYPILDAESLQVRGIPLEEFAEAMREAGVELLQYRDKLGGPQEILRKAASIRQTLAGSGCRLILNDRADLAVLAHYDGVHVGQEDLAPADARRVMGPERWVGVSTHTEEQVEAADRTDANYIAIGPVFATTTKADAEPVIGLEGVRRARALTTKPLVAIGGIQLGNARSVIDAGADSVAVISALVATGQTIAQNARDFLDRLE